MFKAIGIVAGLSLVASAAFAQASTPASTMGDAQIAHVAYTAGVVDVAAGKQALEKSHDKAVRDFAQEMVRDHTAVNDQALALVKKLGVTPQDNPTSQGIAKGGADELKVLNPLSGKAFDKAYVDNEVAYHKKVNGALATVLIPSAKNAELKSLLQTGLKLFQEHQTHAEHLAMTLK